ncbi:hypothetical protein K466DRAFT_571228 [Polyporus arcularius HHB13444]|uniref:Uncharacterized protein n=1 Tax=Polyporus arcularius HHB13444 TaxID=1314778 RepID=A0A5C3NMD0_9APHY|nr:hypothetical protein K466DRAFT_571228 [Polyporus arcularius HHB13444]
MWHQVVSGSIALVKSPVGAPTPWKCGMGVVLTPVATKWLVLIDQQISRHRRWLQSPEPRTIYDDEMQGEVSLMRLSWLYRVPIIDEGCCVTAASMHRRCSSFCGSYTMIRQVDRMHILGISARVGGDVLTPRTVTHAHTSVHILIIAQMDHMAPWKRGVNSAHNANCQSPLMPTFRILSAHTQPSDCAHVRSLTVKVRPCKIGLRVPSTGEEWEWEWEFQQHPPQDI